MASSWYKPWTWARSTAPSSVDERSLALSPPALVDMFHVGSRNYSGVTVSETTALGLSAVWRAVSLISQTIASLPVRVVSEDADGAVVEHRSFLSEPCGPDGPTKFEFWELVATHLLVHGNAYLLHLRNGAGQLAQLQPIHPALVSVDADVTAPGGKVFRVQLESRAATYTARELTHIPGLSADGLVGYSPLSIAANSLGTSSAADRSAAKQFASGAMISMIATIDDELDEDEVLAAKQQLSRSVTGWENAAEIAVINRKMSLTPWTMTAADAQFLESRAFQIEEIARWFGVPPFALMQTDKQTSWGTGIESQQRGLAKTVIHPWTQRIAARIDRLLPGDRHLEFDFTGLERADPAAESARLVSEIRAGLITVNEARALRGLGKLPGGDDPVRPSNSSQEAAP